MTLAADAQPRTVVVAAAAPLWASAEDAREVAPFAASSYPAFRAWAEGRLPDQQPLHGRLHTVALSGEPVRVIGAAAPSLVEVALPAQPNGNDGYVGVMHAAHVGDDARRAATHVVAAGGAHASASDDDAPVELPAGTTVELLAGAEAEGCVEVLLASGARVRCPEAALRPLGPALGAAELFEIAAGFAGVPYLWGGVEDAGIDCSGLVHLAARIGGRVVPRDAQHQWAATRFDARDADELAVGDLLFFGDEASLTGIDHVGLYAGEGRMLHAPEAGRSVVVEPLRARARERTVGFGRYRAV